METQRVLFFQANTVKDAAEQLDQLIGMPFEGHADEIIQHIDQFQIIVQVPYVVCVVIVTVRMETSSGGTRR